MLMRKKIALIGSTGSIGRQVINVCERYPDLFQLVAIAANTGGGLFFEQAEKLRPALPFGAAVHIMGLSGFQRR